MAKIFTIILYLIPYLTIASALLQEKKTNKNISCPDSMHEYRGVCLQNVSNCMEYQNGFDCKVCSQGFKLAQLFEGISCSDIKKLNKLKNGKISVLQEDQQQLLELTDYTFSRLSPNVKNLQILTGYEYLTQDSKYIKIFFVYEKGIYSAIYKINNLIYGSLVVTEQIEVKFEQNEKLLFDDEDEILAQLTIKANKVIYSKNMINNEYIRFFVFSKGQLTILQTYFERSFRISDINLISSTVFNDQNIKIFLSDAKIYEFSKKIIYNSMFQFKVIFQHSNRQFSFINFIYSPNPSFHIVLDSYLYRKLYPFTQNTDCSYSQNQISAEQVKMKRGQPENIKKIFSLLDCTFSSSPAIKTVISNMQSSQIVSFYTWFNQRYKFYYVVFKSNSDQGQCAQFLRLNVNFENKFKWTIYSFHSILLRDISKIHINFFNKQKLADFQRFVNQQKAGNQEMQLTNKDLIFIQVYNYTYEDLGNINQAQNRSVIKKVYRMLQKKQFQFIQVWYQTSNKQEGITVIKQPSIFFQYPMLVEISVSESQNLYDQILHQAVFCLQRYIQNFTEDEIISYRVFQNQAYQRDFRVQVLTYVPGYSQKNISLRVLKNQALLSDQQRCWIVSVEDFKNKKEEQRQNEDKQNCQPLTNCEQLNKILSMNDIAEDSRMPKLLIFLNEVDPSYQNKTFLYAQPSNLSNLQKVLNEKVDSSIIYGAIYQFVYLDADQKQGISIFFIQYKEFNEFQIVKRNQKLRIGQKLLNFTKNVFKDKVNENKIKVNKDQAIKNQSTTLDTQAHKDFNTYISLNQQRFKISMQIFYYFSGQQINPQLMDINVIEDPEGLEIKLRSGLVYKVYNDVMLQLSPFSTLEHLEIEKYEKWVKSVLNRVLKIKEASINIIEVKRWKYLQLYSIYQVKFNRISSDIKNGKIFENLMFQSNEKQAPDQRLYLNKIWLDKQTEDKKIFPLNYSITADKPILFNLNESLNKEYKNYFQLEQLLKDITICQQKYDQTKSLNISVGKHKEFGWLKFSAIQDNKIIQIDFIEKGFYQNALFVQQNGNHASVVSVISKINQHFRTLLKQIGLFKLEMRFQNQILDYQNPLKYEEDDKKNLKFWRSKQIENNIFEIEVYYIYSQMKRIMVRLKYLVILNSSNMIIELSLIFFQFFKGDDYQDMMNLVQIYNLVPARRLSNITVQGSGSGSGSGSDSETKNLSDLAQNSHSTTQNKYKFQVQQEEIGQRSYRSLVIDKFENEPQFQQAQNFLMGKYRYLLNRKQIVDIKKEINEGRNIYLIRYGLTNSNSILQVHVAFESLTKIITILSITPQTQSQNYILLPGCSKYNRQKRYCLKCSQGWKINKFNECSTEIENCLQMDGKKCIKCKRQYKLHQNQCS